MKIAKLDAARRQLDCAIRYWFAEDDPVVIHTLVWAAYEIIEDLNEKKGDKSVTMIEIMRKAVKPERLEEAMMWAKKPMTFFKHANRDPHDILDFDPAANEPMFLFCIKGLEALGERMSDLERSFMFWTRLHDDKLLKEANADGFPVEEIQNLRRLDKKEFLKQVLVFLANSRAHGLI